VGWAAQIPVRVSKVDRLHGQLYEWPSTTHTLVWHCTWSTPKPQPSLSQTGEGSPLDAPERDLRSLLFLLLIHFIDQVFSTIKVKILSKFFV